ncbi:acyl carrier protein [Nocardia transvalensis]|uniref:acyl carrier protein n=1 Tax=Nocardia transvalensis TaxID=37333 RepID=UPI00189534D3|nr:acyl carrier protein [Nocardia transvalensis]MBF6332419.1 acyl carrier protein [Nocardia transvalensis]
MYREHEILEEIRNLLAGQRGGERSGIDWKSIDKSTPLRSLPLDSIMLIELIDRLESSFGVRITPDDVYRASSLSDVIFAVLQKDSEVKSVTEGSQ